MRRCAPDGQCRCASGQCPTDSPWVRRSLCLCVSRCGSAPTRTQLAASTRNHAPALGWSSQRYAWGVGAARAIGAARQLLASRVLSRHSLELKKGSHQLVPPVPRWTARNSLLSPCCAHRARASDAADRKEDVSHGARSRCVSTLSAKGGRCVGPVSLSLALPLHA